MIDYEPHDWYSHFFDIKGSMVREILGRVLLCVVWAAAITATYQLYLDDVQAASTWWTMSVHAALGTALGLLLVFRTNASYDRFWEGRKLWGTIINESRNFAREIVVAYPAATDARSRLLGLLEALPFAAMHHLRGTRGIGPAQRLATAESEQLLAFDHVPVEISRRVTRILADSRDQGQFGEVLFTALDQHVRALIDCMGACERIHKTPLPFAYVVHLRRALILYCYTLPLALVHDFGWWTIPCALMVAYILFGIEEIGVEIEDPFGDDENDLPLDNFCETIRVGIRQLESAASGEPH